MNNQNLNHNLLVSSLITEMINQGITSDKEQCTHYVRLHAPSRFHLVLFGLSSEPIYIKTANANHGANVADRYEVHASKTAKKGLKSLFVYDGIGWLHHNYQDALKSIIDNLEIENVMKKKDFKNWLKNKIKVVSR